MSYKNRNRKQFSTDSAYLEKRSVVSALVLDAVPYQIHAENHPLQKNDQPRLLSRPLGNGTNYHLLDQGISQVPDYTIRSNEAARTTQSVSEGYEIKPTMLAGTILVGQQAGSTKFGSIAQTGNQNKITLSGQPEATPRGNGASSQPVRGGYAGPGSSNAGGHGMAGNGAPANTDAAQATADAVNNAESSSAGIRPMTMAPVAPVDGVPSTGRAGGYSPLDDPPLNTPPTLTASGGGQGAVPVLGANNAPIPGKYTIPTAVPVGAKMTFTVTGPGGTGYNITSYTWSNGSAYNTYFASPATGAPPVAQSSPTAPTTSTSTYTFVCGTGQTSYDVDIKLNYGNMATGEADCTFTVASPTTSITQTRNGTQTFSNTPNQGVYLSPGIKITATAATGANTAGSFMFMQVLTTVYEGYTRTTNGSAVAYYANNMNFSTDRTMYPAGQNFNGTLGDFYGAATGYPYQNVDVNGNPPAPSGGSGGSGGATLQNGWNLAANQSKPNPSITYDTPVMIDSPGFSPGGTPSSVTVSEDFSTYLMYLGSGGVWIALQELDWSWTETAYQSGTTLTGTSSPQDNGTPSVPSGLAAFPSWVNTTANFGSTGNNNAINPLRTM